METPQKMLNEFFRQFRCELDIEQTFYRSLPRNKSKQLEPSNLLESFEKNVPVIKGDVKVEFLLFGKSIMDGTSANNAGGGG